ncbi:MAG: T9SS type A sorting domain-containing protein [Chitinophagales bacterium]|nr:T9SS type A sorting domain-containing protein [Chitinophagales bacterium]
MKQKFYLTFLLLWLLHHSNQVLAQSAPVKEWDYRYGGSGGDFMYDVQQTLDGGYILCGNSQSNISGDKTQNAIGWYDYWILKTDANGIKEWDATYGGNQYEYLVAIRQTSDAGYILGGYTISGISGDVSQPSQGDFDYWIVKTDAQGVIEWDARFGGDSTDNLTSIIQTSDGGYLLGGFSISGLSGDKTQDSQGGYDFWIVKTDDAGVKEWDYRYGGSGYDQLNAVRQTMDGGYILIGTSESGAGGDHTQSSWGMSDYWIVKIDAEGTKEWDARFGGYSYDYLYDGLQTYDGGYLLGGYSESGASGDKSQPSQGSEDLWIVKTDANGVKEWDLRYGGLNNDYFVSVDTTSDGGYLFGGFSDSDAGADKTEDNCGVLYTYDYWVIKTDNEGSKQWDLDFGGDNWEQLGAAHPTIDGGFILGGYANSPASCEKTQNSWGYDDYWIVKLSCETPDKYFADLDGDGYGDVNSFLLTCTVPKGYVKDSTDCDDTNFFIHPNADEIPGNGIDDDCDGEIDEIGVGISNISTDGSITIYPNPASDYLVIEMKEEFSGEIKCSLINSMGENVFSQEVNSKGKSMKQIQLPDFLSTGIYLVKVNLGEDVFFRTLEVQK